MKKFLGLIIASGEVAGKEMVGGSPFTSNPNNVKAGHQRGFDFCKYSLFFLNIYYVDHFWVSTYNNSSKRRTLKDLINKINRSLYIIWLLEDIANNSNKYCIFGLTFQSPLSTLIMDFRK